MSRSARGFTLMEMVTVMVIISIGVLGLTRLFGSTRNSLSANETVQQATQYAQECSESVMTVRRNQGFAWFASNTFSCGAAPSGFTRTNNPVGATYTGTSSGACNGHTPCPCPNTVSCRDVVITVTNATNTAYSSTVTLMLVDY